MIIKIHMVILVEGPSGYNYEDKYGHISGGPLRM